MTNPIDTYSYHLPRSPSWPFLISHIWIKSRGRVLLVKEGGRIENKVQ